LIIRHEQFQVFQAGADAAFEERLAHHILKVHAGATVVLPGRELKVAEIPGALLREMVGKGLARARGYGMRYESSLAAFVSLMFAVAPNFDEHPLIRRVLEDESTPPDLRIEMLDEYVTDENWEAAAQSYDPGAWNVVLPG
jgi:hypothetical protein